MPRQHGRTAIVTGANSGIGFEVSLALARAGAEVFLAARDLEKGRQAAGAIGHGAECRVLDLADLASVRRFADGMLTIDGPLDLLILNAGVMALPTRQLSADGRERQFATNHLGHFALAARLWPLLAKTPGARVVVLSSIAAKRARMDFDDLDGETRYRPWDAYSRSKLANLLFMTELARRAEGTGVTVLAAHPGFARTNLIANGPGTSPMRDFALRWLGGLVSQPQKDGALPILRAATDPAATTGDYYGSTGFQELKGPPGPVPLPPAARDREAARRLWEASERLAGVEFRP